MKVFLFVLAAAVVEATGDAILRVAMHHSSMRMRLLLFIVGACLLTLYGTSLNLAPLDFARVTGLYVAIVFVVFQANSYLFFDQAPTLPAVLGGTLIVAGGAIVTYWR